ncbi:hypothetical protein M0R45_020335 [Rubus argutus]|uniref:F-box domain-containing protein n=1 Tax=Rubus argutus TaxID=59490 RepID=A0AAW1X8W3_RUBAR
MVDLCYSWSDPPIDILCEVANRLPYEDLVRFAAVCKSWRVIIYRVHLQQRSPLGMPYLMSYILCEVASRLPYEDLVRFAATAFVLVLLEEEEEGCIIGTCKPGDQIWRFHKTGGFKDWGVVKNVTYLNGIFCFLIRSSQPWSVVLGTLDVALEEDSVDMDYASITVVQEEYRYAEDLLLVESDGELLLAVIRTFGGAKPSYWNVYRFDWSRKDWTRVLGLGNQVLIFRQWWFNSSVSIACPTSGEESKFANMIFCDGVGGTHSFTCTSQDGVWIKKP